VTVLLFFIGVCTVGAGAAWLKWHPDRTDIERRVGAAVQSVKKALKRITAEFRRKL
jgi:hypothetical protein